MLAWNCLDSGNLTLKLNEHIRTIGNHESPKFISINMSWVASNEAPYAVFTFAPAPALAIGPARSPLLPLHAG